MRPCEDASRVAKGESLDSFDLSSSPGTSNLPKVEEVEPNDTGNRMKYVMPVHICISICVYNMYSVYIYIYIYIYI